jgi:hypothetical protein
MIQKQQQQQQQEEVRHAAAGVLGISGRQAQAAGTTELTQ